MRKGYSKQELLALGPQRIFTGPSLKMISFPLGGIGTGSIGLSGRGGLVDWEIFNRPNVGSSLPRTFPVLYARETGQAPVCRILQAPALPPHQHTGTGEPFGSGEGLPHMDNAAFRGEYPFAWIDFTSKAMPLQASLEAYNPYIPSEADDSGFPAAILRYTLTNPTDNIVDATLAWSMLNAVGSIGEAANDPNLCNLEFGFGQNVNQFVEESGLRGLLFTSDKWPTGHPRHGSMALLTPDRPVTVMTHWLRSGGYHPMHEFWDDFSEQGRFPEHEYGPSEEGLTDAGALGVRMRLKPGESRTVRFYVTWYFPVYEKYWAAPIDDSGKKRPTWPNYYASQFENALDVARQLHRQEAKLLSTTRAFHDALFSSTLPPHALDAISSQMSILKTTTCLRLTDGTFYGFEGCLPTSGCCEGSCTHVWNYQQTLPFLFPSLERSMRNADYRYNMRENGSMCFRLPLPLGTPPNRFHACGDGQMGGIIKTYREWKISGDDDWLRSLWPTVKQALEYAWVDWDPNREGIMRGIQHNTYDIEFHGPNTMMGAFYLAALVAGAEMAEYLGESEAAAEYRAVYQRGRAWLETNLFNGEFYIQQCDPDMPPEHQYGEGCLSDQVLGQWTASLTGLGYVLDRAQVRKTLKAIFTHNWRSSLANHPNAQRVFALNDEAGLLLCSWPNGGRPDVPMLYCDEVWTGIEYQVASHLLYEGYPREALAIVKGARDRHDGIRRNPWNEFECGHHYARAMSAYGLLLAASGFQYDHRADRIGFAPRIHEEDFQSFWALDGVWGTYAQQLEKAELRICYGSLPLRQLDLAWLADMESVTVERIDAKGNKKLLSASLDGDTVILSRPIILKASEALRIRG